MPPRAAGRRDERRSQGGERRVRAPGGAFLRGAGAAVRSCGGRGSAAAPSPRWFSADSDAARMRGRPDGASSPVAGRLPTMGKLVRRTLDGDKTVAEWSADDPDSVRAAADAMRREVDAGYVAVEGGEGRNEPVDDLPPDADVVILTMPMGGG